MDEIYISESGTNFKPQTSLLDKSYEFKSKFINGGVFFMSTEGGLGGDTFIISASSYLTISLVGDMQGHEEKTREKVKEIFDGLEKLVYVAKSSQNKEDIIREVLELDSRLDAERDNLLAVSFVKVISQNNICYFNHGENKLYMRRNGVVEDRSLEHGVKIGVFKLIPPENFEKKMITPSELELGKGDMIFMFTDGVSQYIEADDSNRTTLPFIKQSIKKSNDIYGCISDINAKAYKRLNRAGLSLADDYTLIGLQVI